MGELYYVIMNELVSLYFIVVMVDGILEALVLLTEMTLTSDAIVLI